jgi:hypothetical protein
MDVRRKTFVAEATSRLAFLCADNGSPARTSAEPDPVPEPEARPEAKIFRTW